MSYYTFERVNASELCLARAEEEISRRAISFDDVERVSGIHDTSRWGSDASRRKRSRALAEFKRRVMTSPSLLDEFHLK